MSFAHLSRQQLVELLDDLLARQERDRSEQERVLAEQTRRVNDLGVYQRELELQNRELRDTQVALEHSRDNYLELYNRQLGLLEQLRTAVESRDTLLALVSHDLRSPLNAISLTARNMVQPAPPTGERRRSGSQVELIQRSVARMSHLVEDLLAAANIDAGHFSVEADDTFPCNLVHEALEANEPAIAARGLTCERACSDDLPEVRADRARVLQVFTNLLVNAIKFTPRGGKLTVSAERVGDEVRFCVSDTGPGIAADQQAQVFVRYWTGRMQRGGLGLGLFIAEQIVQAHGGRIWVESARSGGAAFCFTLPLASTQPLRSTGVMRSANVEPASHAAGGSTRRSPRSA